MRKSEWFGGILREDQPGETEGERLSRKIGLIRRYRGKDFVLPLGVQLLFRARQLLELSLPRTTPVIYPLHGRIVDLGVDACRRKFPATNNSPLCSASRGRDYWPGRESFCSLNKCGGGLHIHAG